MKRFLLRVSAALAAGLLLPLSAAAASPASTAKVSRMQALKQVHEAPAPEALQRFEARKSASELQMKVQSGKAKSMTDGESVYRAGEVTVHLERTSSSRTATPQSVAGWYMEHDSVMTNSGGAMRNYTAQLATWSGTQGNVQVVRMSGVPFTGCYATVSGNTITIPAGNYCPVSNSSGATTLALVCPLDPDKMVYDPKGKITGTIADDGTITLQSWGIFVVDSTGHGASVVQANFYTSMERANGLMSGMTVPSTGEPQLMQYPVRISQPNANRLVVDNFGNTGLSVFVNVSYTGRLEVAPQYMGTAMQYGRLSCMRMKPNHSGDADTIMTVQVGATNVLDLPDWGIFADADPSKYLLRLTDAKLTIDGFSLTLPQKFPTNFSGAGTETSPYIIKSYTDLMALQQQVREENPAKGLYYRLDADIDCAGQSYYFTPIGFISANDDYALRDNTVPGTPFTGHFDGNGHTIKGIDYECGKLAGTGAFSWLAPGASVSNLTVSGSTFYSEGISTGAIAGYNEGEIINCKSLNNQVMFTDHSGGGIAGGSTGLIEGCVSTSILRGYGSMGSIAGTVTGPVRSCEGRGSVTHFGTTSSLYDYTGGLIGYISTTYNSIEGMTEPLHVNRCYNVGYVWCRNRTTHAGVFGDEFTSTMTPEKPSDTAFTNAYSDNQATGLLDDVYGRATTFFTGATLPAGFTSTAWTASAGRYPVLKAFADSRQAALASAVVQFADGESSRVMKHAATLSAPQGVNWYLVGTDGSLGTASDGLTISGTQVQLGSVYANDTLVAAIPGVPSGRRILINVVPKLFDGEGTASSPYLIKSKADFQTLHTAVMHYDHRGDHFLQTSDVDFGLSADFAGVAAGNHLRQFAGVFDGGNHRIHRLRIHSAVLDDNGKTLSGTYNYGGLFHIGAKESVLRNIVIDADCDFDFYGNAAPVVGYTLGRVENCRNYASVKNAYSRSGGIAGSTEEGAVVTGCYNAGDISAAKADYIGGITGYNLGLVTDCQNDGTVRTDSILPSAPYAGTAAAAGLVGSTGGSLLIANCVNQGDVSAAREVAGIVARCADGVMLRNVVNTGMLTMTDRKSVTGGIAATNRNTVTYENVYYDRQMIYAGAANSIYPGATGLDTRDLTAGTTLQGLPVDTFDFQAGKLPVLKAFKDEKAAVAMRNMALMLAAGENTNEVETAATLATGDGVRWTLAGDGFTLSGSTVTPKALDQPGTGTLNATLGGYTRAIGLQSMHVPFTGKGTEQEPYLLDTYADWKNLSKYNNTYGFRYEGKHFAMTKDVECDSTDNFYAIAFNSANHFMGDIDGRNHTLRHLRMEYVDKTATDTYENVGVISFLGYAGSLRNLRLNGHIRGYKYTGGLVGVSYGTVDNCHNDGYVATTNNTNTGGVVCAANGGTIRNCSNTGLIEGRYTHVGGVASYVAAGVRIENCFNAGTVSAADSLGTRRYTIVGGVVGQMSGIMRNCHNRGTVIGDGTLGGVAGYAADIDSCANYSDIAATGSTVGGVAGRAAYRMSHCYNYGNISANNYTGGVVGDISSKAIVDYCSNRGTVTGRSKAYTGGVAGDVSTGATLDSCANYGAVLGTGTNSGYVGGVTGGGTSSITLSRLVNHAPVTVSGGASTYYVAGIAGACGGTITDSYNYGAVSNTSYGTAGISGYGVGKAYRCVNLGNVATSYTGTSKYGNAGGIWGHNGGQIYDCVNYGNVSGNKYVGGIMGYSATSTKVARVYFSGKLTCPDAATTGAIIHSEPSQTKVTCDSAYYNTDLCPDLQTNDRDAAFAKGVTARDLKSAALGDAFDLHPHALPTLKAFAGVADLNAAACILNFKDDESASAFRTSLRIERFPGVNVTVTPNLKVEGDKVWVVSTKPLDPATITVKGPGYERVFTVTTDNGGTGVDGLDSDRTPLSVRYFTLDGMEVTNPAPGTTVVRITLFTDGTAATEKVVIR